jgi:AmmeMemoRadiSam system protein A
MPISRPLLLLVFLGFFSAAAGYASANAGKEQDMHLSEQDKTTLHEIARQSIAAGLQGQCPVPLKDVSGVLQEPRGAFVSLHLKGCLRGCIGLIEAIKPLAEAIQEMAYSAAFSDPRFSPLTDREFKDLALEISVLSPLRQIKNVDEIQVGVHGLYIRLGSCRGLLLPQVATEYNWDRETFLQQTCCKACLPPMAWKDPKAEIYIFSADIF